MSDGPRFDRKQVVHNLALAFGGLIRAYRDGLGEMTFRGNDPVGVIQDAILEACRMEKVDVVARSEMKKT